MKLVITDKNKNLRIESNISDCCEKTIDEIREEIKGKNLSICVSGGKEIEFFKEDFDFKVVDGYVEDCEE